LREVYKTLGCPVKFRTLCRAPLNVFRIIKNYYILALMGGNIRVDLREIGWKDVDWIHLAQDRDQWQALVNMVMKLRVP
jgi:hypothetical protein